MIGLIDGRGLSGFLCLFFGKDGLENVIPEEKKVLLGGPKPEMVKPGPVSLGDWNVMYPPISVADNSSELEHRRYLL